jgi:hypothetical protein
VKALTVTTEKRKEDNREGERQEKIRIIKRDAAPKRFLFLFSPLPFPCNPSLPTSSFNVSTTKTRKG